MAGPRPTRTTSGRIGASGDATYPDKRERDAQESAYITPEQLRHIAVSGEYVHWSSA